MITTKNIGNLEESLDLLKALKTTLDKIFDFDFSEGDNDEREYC